MLFIVCQPRYNSSMEDSIFTRIIKGEIPCNKIYEDDQVIAFLDIEPITPGHTLVVPKQQIDPLWALDDPLYQRVMEVARKVAKRQEEVLKPQRVGMTLMGFDVPHAHIHIFPLNKGFTETYMEYVEKRGAEPDSAALAAMAKKLAF